MMIIKHNKMRNTGILFELLVRTITADALSNKTSPAVDILKKHFIKSELGKEYKLYETVFKNIPLSETKAEITLNAVLEASHNLNKNILKREKYNLIKDIKEHYNLNEFFKTKISNYKAQASLYMLIETYSNKDIDPSQIINNKVNLLECLTSTQIKPAQESIDEFKGYDKDLRILTYKILLEKFNEKYNTLNSDQKLILKEYINIVDNASQLKEFYNKKIGELKLKLTIQNKDITNPVTKIKLTEVINLLKPISKTENVKNENVVSLLQYYSLVEELNNTKQ
jgi:hypothetical protein